MKLGGWRRRDEELDEEIRGHLRMAIRERVERGETPEQAEVAARREFGNEALVKEVTRGMWGRVWLRQFGQDVRYGLRTMRRTPWFTAAAVVTMAIGVGANTALFSVVDAVLLKKLPVKEPERLVLFRWTSGPKFSPGSHHGNMTRDESGRLVKSSFAHQTYARLRGHPGPLSDVLALGSVPLNVSADGRADVANGQAVSGNYYAALGVPALVGRAITDEDDRAAAPPVAVLSYRYWQWRFAGDPRVVGRQISLNNVAFTVAGITPQGFNGTMQVGSSPDVSIPIAWEPQVSSARPLMAGAGAWWLRLMGRLKPGATPEQARASLELIFQQSALDHRAARVARGENRLTPLGPEDYPRLVAYPGSQGETTTRQYYQKPLYILLGVVGMVLLIACANVANLLLARAAA